MNRLKTTSPKRTIRSIFNHAIFIALGLAAIAGWGPIRFGSIAGALAYLEGDALIAEVYTKSFGRVIAGSEQTIQFFIKNLSNHSVTIIGGRSSCTCVATGDFPLTIPPGGERPVTVKVSTSRSSGSVAEKITLYTYADNEKGSFIVLNVVGYAAVRGPGGMD